MAAKVLLDNVSLKFRTYHGSSSGLKEAVMRLLSRPGWVKQLPAQRQEFWGLKNINLSLGVGARLGIVGRNGAGKSTLLKIISRVYQPTLGKVELEGRIAPLIEIGAGLNPELSGRENAFLNGAILGIPRKVIARRMEDIIRFSELEEFIDTPVKHYSTGMFLRLAFTVATEISPNILVLDELYAGGDAAFIEKANSRLREFIRQSQILITVAHNLEYITEFCNHVIVLDHGQIIGRGEPKEMCKRYLDFCAGDAKALPHNA